MDDFYRAGGLLAVLREVRDLLHPTAVTVTGRPLVDYLDAAPIWDPEVIRLRREPLLNEGGIAVLRGNLAPAGAIIKPAAASPHLIQHRGRALVFDSIEDFHARIDAPELEMDASWRCQKRSCSAGDPTLPPSQALPIPYAAGSGST
jgi:dihydroxyacid dehydratase/phosphogluconate dehydratase